MSNPNGLDDSLRDILRDIGAPTFTSAYRMPLNTDGGDANPVRFEPIPISGNTAVDEPTLPFKEPMKVDYWRQLDFYNPANDDREVLIVGAGSIGSYTAFCLQRMGVKNITVVDFDIVEPHNIPNQFFIPPTSKELKVKALHHTLQVISPSLPPIKVFPVKWEIFRQMERMEDFAAVFMCVDDMNVRDSIYATFKNTGNTHFIADARVGGQFGHVFSIVTSESNDCAYFEAKLWTNEDTAPLPCTATMTNYVAMGISAELCARYAAYVANSLLVMHTVHDYSVGQSYIMQQRKPVVAMTDQEIHNLQVQ